MNTDSKTPEYEVHTHDGHVATFMRARDAAKYISDLKGRAGYSSRIKVDGVVFYAEGQTPNETKARLEEYCCYWEGEDGLFDNAHTAFGQIITIEENFDFIVRLCDLMKRTKERKERNRAKIMAMCKGMTVTWVGFDKEK